MHEYKTIGMYQTNLEKTGKSLEETLNRWAKQGWEVVSVAPQYYNAIDAFPSGEMTLTATYWIVVVKRPIQSEKAGA